MTTLLGQSTTMPGRTAPLSHPTSLPETQTSGLPEAQAGPQLQTVRGATAATSVTTVTTDFTITDADRTYFAENGYIKLRGVIPAEQLDYFEPLITERVIQLNTQHLPLALRATYGKAFLQVTNLWTRDERVSAFVHSRDLARIAAELLGVPSVRLYHDQALYKEPGGGITPWHADQFYWPLSSDRCCTVWIPLQDTPAAMGPLTFFAGSHRVLEGRELEISDQSEAQISQNMAMRGFRRDDSPYAYGDVSYHLGWTFHGAGANTGSAPRRVMTMIYVAADMVIAEPDNDNRRGDLAQWFPGQQPGDVVCSWLNPVLYP